MRVRSRAISRVPAKASGPQQSCPFRTCAWARRLNPFGCGFEEREGARIVQSEKDAISQQERSKPKLLAGAAAPDHFAVRIQANKLAVGPDSIQDGSGTKSGTG